MKTRYDVAEIRSLRDRGMSAKEIAEAIGSKEEYVRRLMARLGIPRLARKARPEKNVHWKGGRTIDKNGYVLVHRPGHPNSVKSGYIREHRLVMSESIGRPLRPGEVVHHIDGDRTNNRIENLQLFSKNADHLRHELTGKVPNWTPEGKKRIVDGVRRSGRARRSSRSPSESGGQAPPA